MIGGLGFGELVLVFAVLLLLFGAKRLPELASGMGKGIRDFKRSLNGLDDQSIHSNEAPQSLQQGQPQSLQQSPPQPPVTQQPPATAEAEPKRLQD